MAINTDISITADITSNFILGGFVFVLTVIAIGLYIANKDPNNQWSWLHLVQGNDNKGSLTKFLQFIGGMTGTFVVVFQTVKSTLSVELFAVYLAALGVSEGFSKWVYAKYGNKDEKKES